MYEAIEISETTEHARKRIMRLVNRDAKVRAWEIRCTKTGQTVGIVTDSTLVHVLQKARDLANAMRVYP